VSGIRSELAAVLNAGPDFDAEELLELAQGLRGELLELDVDAVGLEGQGEAPDNTYSPATRPINPKTSSSATSPSTVTLPG
jgi:hypothetical protein